ncbi:SgrR family transcriptional regulator [Macrococcus brunensis]|uniref:SgrR family transcriptional regulator n=1 Tax=Macrococcus brunensis TaxID=198483 RepID=UPI001EF11F78|nr:SgrR family transcriptional regulator [Macrococcus brunensis]ULG71816.1 SgrR family transcriptional regulator [Macrococcus brunensis]
MEVNERVFKMYLYLKENSFDRNQVADLLGITSRQLTRLLGKWQDEGILSYTSGSGRGNASELHFNINVEQEFINYFLKNTSVA